MADVQTSDITDIKSVQRNVLRYSLAGVVLIAILSAVFVMVPMYGQLKHALEKDLHHITQSKADAISQFLSRVKSIANQVSSRTRARKLLEAYQSGKIAQADLDAGLSPILASAIQSSEEMVGVTRVDQDGNQVFGHGVQADRSTWPKGWIESGRTEINGPLLLDGKHRLLVSSPILDPKANRVGTDIVVFSIDAMFHLA